jgi:hypothetical protein
MKIYTYAAEEQYTKLQAFRQACYERLGTARDALFDLGDAVILSPAVSSFAEFSLSPVFRRRWPSVYEALQDGRPDREGLLSMYLNEIPTQRRPILAGDHTAWPRPSAFTLRDRTVEHHPTKVVGNRPITVGEGYATIGWIPEDSGSWALPLLHERISSVETPLGKAASQLREVCQELPIRPISLWDSEYGCASFVQQTEDIPADKIFRLRPNRCLWGPPGTYSGKGRPKIHGDKLKLKDQDTWPQPVATLEKDDPKLGHVCIQQWNDLHFRRAPDHPMVVLRIERPDARGTRRDPRDFWLAWQGKPPPSLEEWWRLYLRRFAADHWYRFAKQRLHWTLPRVKTPQQAERWSDLLTMLTWQLWLARDIIVDCPLPWQKPQAHPTPGRTCQGMAGVLTQIGTPAVRPKPRGKSPGWPRGRPRAPSPRYPVVKKIKKKQA